MADSKSPSRNDIQRPRHARLAVLLKKSAAGAAGPNTALLKRLPRPTTARVPHVDKSDIQRPRHERLEVLKGDAAAAAGPNTALLKRLLMAPRARVPHVDKSDIQLITAIVAL